jgi:PAS domain S-box-containing protein
VDLEWLDALQVQIWTADQTGALTYVNAFTAAYFGRSREQLVGEGWQNVLHATDLPRAVAAWTDSIQTGNPYGVDFRLLRGSDKIYRWHRASGRRVAGPDGHFWLGSNVDVDAERRAEEVAEAARVLALRGRR